jgi:putative alpha-1,2-mannosidase
MSAWYVFSALGFYPCNPASGEYILGSPLIDEATIRLPGERSFKIKVRNNSKTNKYIQEVRLNGKPYPKVFINHSAILSGGILEVTMGPQPSKTWGVSPNDFPRSMTANH